MAPPAAAVIAFGAMTTLRIAPRAVRALVALLLALSTALLAASASAVGNVTVANREPEEVDGRWKLAMTINYGSVPHLTYVPMIFIFTPVALYERSLTDQSPDKPVLTRVPLRNQQSINESMDVGFSDGTGKAYQTTKFHFVIRRDRGFEAGEYTLQIKRAGDGVQLGQTITLKLKGENPVVDRRAIVFAGEKKEKKKPAESAEGASADSDKEKENKDAPAEPAASEPAPEAEATPPEANGAPAPPPVPPKQGGCGCRLAGGDAETAGGAGALLLVSFAAVRRARRRAA